jgi:hypothetical protein
MLVEPSGTAATVGGAIRQAARMTGASFQYLLAAARIESNLKPTAKASTSSAGGLFQFIEQTWLTTLKEKGPALGFGAYADAISRLPSGGYTVTDPAVRSAILNLRSDPVASALMAGAFTNANATLLASRLGRGATDGELYIAHFLGANGAGRLIGMAETNPQAPAATAFPAAARANPRIFYNRQGEPRSVADVYGLLVGRYNVARARTANIAVAELPSDTNGTPDVALPPQPAARSGSPIFAVPLPPASAPAGNGISAFGETPQVGIRRAAVAPVVSALWTTPGASSESSQVAPTPDRSIERAPAPVRQRVAVTAKVNVLDLFRDLPGDASALFRRQG